MEAPEVVVTFVIDGGGWNVLQEFPDAWPNLRRLMRDGANFRNAIHGSFPAVTASAHATIGTGAFPRTHGITGHNLRDGRRARKAYGELGHVNPGDILVPTLADLWSDATDNRAWIGELGYQVWHLGMIGRGGPSRTRRPAAGRGLLGRGERPAGLAEPERRALPAARASPPRSTRSRAIAPATSRTPLATPRSTP